MEKEAKGTEQAVSSAMDAVFDEFGVPGPASEPKTSDSEVEEKPVSETEQTEGDGDSESDKSEPEEGEEKEDEETLMYTQAELDREAERKAQSMKDKELKSVYAEMDELNNKLAEANRKLEDKQDSKLLDSIFEGDSEEFGEDEARQRKFALEEFNKRYREYKKNASEIEEKHAKVEVEIEKLGKYARYQKSMDFYLDLRDKGLATTKEKDAILKELEDCDTMKEWERATKAISAEYQNKKPKKTFKPDSSRGSGGGGGLTLDKIRKMSPDEKIRRNDEIVKFFAEQEE